jgi:hypothetical protein
MLRIIETMPQQVEKELQTLLEQEQQQRELKESLNARTVV